MRTPVLFAVTALALGTVTAHSEPAAYRIDPDHTYVSIETPHIPQGSYWRGKFDRTQSGLLSLDRRAHKGSVEVVIETNSLDFGLDKLNETVRGPQFLDSVKYPTATFRAESISFQGDKPVQASGVLSLHGVDRPLILKINSFNCILDQYLKVERCAADASGVIDRTAFGITNYAQMTGGDVKLAIQVEGLLQK